nr:hypothetical protein [Tanacetum cinerariifolium]
MVAILEKYEQNTDFHQIVDFVGASHIRYALTFNPTIYVSHIQQFWSTARIETIDEGTKILATVDGILRTVTESSIRARIAQSSTLPPVADEPASPMGDVSQGEACPTDSGFVADQDRANIAKTSTLPHESTSRVTPLAADEGSLQLRFQELTNFYTSLQRRRLDEGEVATERVSSDTKEIRRNEGDVAAERVSDDTEEMATVLITMDAASVLSSGGVQVVPTAASVAPANVITPYTRRKGKEKMVENHTPKKKKRLQEQTDIQFARELKEELEREAQRMNAQITRHKEIAKIHAEEELQQMINGLDMSNETIAKHLEEYEQAVAELKIREIIELISKLVKYQDHHSKILQYQAQQRKTRTKKQKRDFYMVVIRNNLGWKVKDFKGMSLEEVEAKFKTVWEQIKGSVSKISIDREDLNQLWALVKETLSVRPATDEKEMEL